MDENITLTSSMWCDGAGGVYVDVCVRGQHIYKYIWYAVVGEVLVCERESNNFQDRYVAAVKRENSAHLIFVHKATRENILTKKLLKLW